MYSIVVTHGELVWKITRRYRDFNRLHGRLQARHTQLPLLPPKKWSVDPRERMHLLIQWCRWWENMIKEVVAERREKLQGYLNALMQVREIAASVELLSFLGGASMRSTIIDLPIE